MGREREGQGQGKGRVREGKGKGKEHGARKGHEGDWPGAFFSCFCPCPFAGCRLPTALWPRLPGFTRFFRGRCGAQLPVAQAGKRLKCGHWIWTNAVTLPCPFRQRRTETRWVARKGDLGFPSVKLVPFPFLPKEKGKEGQIAP